MRSIRGRIDLVKRAHYFSESVDALNWPSVAAITPHAFLMLLSFIITGIVPLKTDSLCRLAQGVLWRIPGLLQECCVRDFDFLMFFSLCWLFPPHMSWGRVNPRIVHIVCMMEAAAGLATLLQRLSMPPQAKMSHRHANLARFFPLDLHARMALGGSQACEAATAWLELLISVSCDSQIRLQDVGVTYVAGLSIHHRNVYVGFCSGIRNTHGPCFGFAQRWYDHKVREIRVHVGQERRYKMWRVCSLPHKNHATPAWIGLKHEAYRREQFILRAFTLPLQTARKRKTHVKHSLDPLQSACPAPDCVRPPSGKVRELCNQNFLRTETPKTFKGCCQSLHPTEKYLSDCLRMGMLCVRLEFAQTNCSHGFGALVLVDLGQGFANTSSVL